MNVMEKINAPKLLSFSAYIGNRIQSTNQKTSNARLFIRKGAFLVSVSVLYNLFISKQLTSTNLISSLYDSFLLIF